MSQRSSLTCASWFQPLFVEKRWRVWRWLPGQFPACGPRALVTLWDKSQWHGHLGSLQVAGGWIRTEGQLVRTGGPGLETHLRHGRLAVQITVSKGTWGGLWVPELESPLVGRKSFVVGVSREADGLRWVEPLTHSANMCQCRLCATALLWAGRVSGHKTGYHSLVP